MQIIIEYVLIENLIINFFILKTCESFIKEKARLKFLNCFLGAIFALFTPVFNLTVVGSILVKILFGAIMVCLSFSFKTLSKFLYIYFSFALMTFVFGGATAMLSQTFGSLSVFAITLSSGIVFMFISVFLKIYNKQKIIKNFQYSVRIQFNGLSTMEKGYFDSGNILYDTITNKPIVLISPSVFERMTGKNYFEFVLKNEEPTSFLKNGHYIPASTSMSQGKMLVFEVDNLQILQKDNQVKEFENIFVGLSFAEFEKSFNTGLLLHSSLI